MAVPTKIVSASEFKAKCLDILDRVGRREWESIAITKRGRVVAVLSPPAPEATSIDDLYGALRGSAILAPGVDLTAPVLEEPLGAETGLLHR